MAILTFLGLHQLAPLATTMDGLGTKKTPRPVLSLMPVAVTRRPGKQTLREVEVDNMFWDVCNVLTHFPLCISQSIIKHQIASVHIPHIYVHI